MTKLNQLVAVEKGEKASVNKETALIFQAASKPDLFAGFTKTYEPLVEGGAQYPDDTKAVVHTVGQLLNAFSAPTARLMDVTASKENTNRKAVADVVVDGTVIIEKAPVTFLLQFEKYLQQEVRGLVTSLPTLDQAQTWDPDPSGAAGTFVTAEVKRGKTRKVNKVLTLAPATDKHPAQVQVVAEDELEGYWTEKRQSGAVSAARKLELVQRVDKLINAVKFAREEANSVEVEDLKVGSAVFGYLFA